MEKDYIIEFWGKANLCRWLEADLQELNVDSTSKRFLIEIGLPCMVGLTLRFGVQQRFVADVEMRSRYFQIGSDDEVPLCIDNSRGGCVVALENSVESRYVNAHVTDFAECLFFYEQYRRSVRDATDDQVVEIISTTEGKMKDVDFSAFDNAENWWPVVVEQMHQGLL